MLGAVGLGAGLCIADGIAQGLQAAAEIGGQPVGGGRAVLQVFVEIGLHHGVGDAGGHVRRRHGGGDLDDKAAFGAGDGDGALQRGECAGVGLIVAAALWFGGRGQGGVGQMFLAQDA